MKAENRIRILHVITRLDPGGSTDDTLLTVASLDASRFLITLAHGPTQGPRSLAEESARQKGVVFRCVPDLVRDIRPWRDLRALVALWRLMRQESYQIVHTHTSKAGFLGRIAARLARVPLVVHKPHGHVFYGYYGPALTRLFIWLERWAAGFTDRIITLSARGAEEHVAAGVATPEKFVTIHSGVDFSPAAGQKSEPGEVRKSLGIAPEGLVVGTLGRLTAIKGQRDLVEAFAGLNEAVDNAWLLLVGDGEMRSDLEQQASGLGLQQRVVFAGWRDDIYNLLRAMDIFALPSWNEGMGKALVEAMYVGVAPVATAVGGVPDIVEDGKCGLLVPSRQPGRLCAALIELANDAEKRHRLGQEAARRARLYSAEHMMEKLEALYESLIGEGD